MATRTLIATVLMLAAVMIAKGQLPAVDYHINSATTITSNSFPNPYVHGPIQNFYVTAPVGSVIQFTVLLLDTRPMNAGCDSVTINGGPYAMATLCGFYNTPMVYTTFGSVGSVVFKTVDVNVMGHKGFQIKIDFISPVNPWYSGNVMCGRSKYDDGILKNSVVSAGNLWTTARQGEYPWQVMIQDTLDPRMTCGGSIINENWILTAGHCVENGLHAGRWIVYAGSVARFGGFKLLTGAVLLHPLYFKIGTTPQNDFAMIKLREPLIFTEDIKPICPPLFGQGFTGESGIISGWGLTGLGLSGPSAVLKGLMSFVPTNAECQITHGPLPDSTITEAMICAHGATKELNSCQGDSGGPLAIKGPDDIFRLAGVVSWGKVPCNMGPYGVYARVTWAMDWIQSILYTY